MRKKKKKLSKEISGKNIAEVQDKVDQVLDNAKKREKQLKKEVEAMNHSKKAFEKAKAESNKIEDEDDKKSLMN
ncbi:YkyA family protein [Staphylococcus pseudintermedius]